MEFNIAFFTHLGATRTNNQDRILIWDDIYKDGLYSRTNMDSCFCFVADGIGGSKSGDIAAQFVLEQINKRIHKDKELSREKLEKIFT